MKTCSKCGTLKPLEAFTQEKNRKGELRHRADCKECHKETFRRFMDQHPGYARKRYHAKNLRETMVAGNKERRQIRYAAIRRIKEGSPCLDCGGFFPGVAMDFDHRDRAQKITEIPTMVKRYVAWPTILAEIAKCDLVCANCHRLRTYPGDGGKCYKTRRFHHHFKALGVLKESVPCVECGKHYRLQQMDFDHLDRSTKTANVARMVEGPTELLVQELGKCQLVCANCHRIREETGVRKEGDQRLVETFEAILRSTPYPTDSRYAPFPFPDLLGVVPDRELSERTGMSVAMVSWHRRRAGIVLRKRAADARRAA